MALNKPNPIGAMTGANDGVASGIIGHAVNLERLKVDEARLVFGMLRKLEAKLIDDLNKLDPTVVGGKTRTRRLQLLLANIQKTVKANYALIAKSHTETLTSVAGMEKTATANAIGQGVANNPKVGVAIMQTLPPTTTLANLVNNTLIMGAPQKSWWARQAGDLAQRFQDQMREGILAGEGVDDLTRRVRGTKSQGYKDGIMHIKRYQAEALVRTSVQAVSNAARSETIMANADILDGLQWLATLDSRTSAICRARSGLVWTVDGTPVGHSKKYSPPPAHWNCRSVVVPITKSWEDLSNTPLVFKDGEFSEKFKGNLAAQGFTAAQIKNIRANMQSSMNGQVAAEFTYEDWIKTQPVELQQSILGMAKWRLWSDNKIGFVDLVDQRSNPLSLADLQKLIDDGRTSIAKASTLAANKAKQEAEAAAKNAAELKAKEQAAENQLNVYKEGGTGFVNFKVAYNKLSKQGKLDGKSFQEQVALVQAGKEAIDQAAMLANIKKKFGDSKKLSPSELKTYNALDSATKAEIRVLAAQKGLLKQVDDAIEQYNTKFKGINYELKKKLKFSGNEFPVLIKTNFKTPPEQLVAAEKGMAKLDEILKEEKTAGALLQVIQDNPKTAGFVISDDEIDFIINKGAVFKSNLEKLEDLNSANTVKIKQIAELDEFANDTLQQFSTAQKGSGLLTQKKVYADLKNDVDFKKLSPTQQVDKVQEITATTKANADFQALKSTISTKIAQGKPLTKGEQLKIDSFDDVQKEAFEAAVLKKTGKAPPPATPQNDQQLVFANLKQTGGQDGSNIGATFVDKATGVEYYVKAPNNPIQAKVEVLASKLYEAAGVRTAKLQFIDITGDIGNNNVAGKLGIASKMEKVTDLDTSQMKTLTGAKEGFAADAWLANWDVIGTGGAKSLNLKKLADGGAFRLDTGASMNFRARGGIKEFNGNDVPEIDSLRVRSINAEATEVFGDINQDQIVAGVARIVKISDGDIRRLVNDTMGDDAGDFADILIARKNILAKRYEKELTKLNKVDEIPPQKNITKVEIDNIEKGNMNGYSVAIDKDEIEDQLVHFYNYFDENKAKKLGSYFKVRGAAATKLDKMTLQVSGGSGQTVVVNFDAINKSLLENIKGLRSRFNNGADFDDKSLNRITDFRRKLLDLRQDAKYAISDGKIDAKDFEKLDKVLSAYAKDLTKILDNNEVGKQIKNVVWHTEEQFNEFDNLLSKVKFPKSSEIVWVKEDSIFKNKKFKDGVGTETNKFYNWSEDKVYVTKIDGVTVKYWRGDANTALKNRLELFTDGGAITANQHLNVMQKLGINSAKATIDDREELYLLRTLYAQAADDDMKRGITWWQQRLDKLKDLKTQKEKIIFLRKEVSDGAGVKDITTLPTYKPLGEWQALGNGRITTYRPDTFGDEWNKFYDEHVIFHNVYRGFVKSIKNIVEGGGHMAPTTDKFRRGIVMQGMSPEKDIRTGGGSYFFTRIRSKDREKRAQGLVWNSRLATRSDAISYAGDRYGKTINENYVIGERGTSAKQLTSFKNDEANETIFKDSLSLYDNLKYIVVDSASDREELIIFFKSKMQRWPDGRKIEEVIVRMK